MKEDQPDSRTESRSIFRMKHCCLIASGLILILLLAALALFLLLAFLTRDNWMGGIRTETPRQAMNPEMSILEGLRFLSPSAQTDAVPWRYTTLEPSEDWEGPDFNDSGWREGEAGFGASASRAPIRTQWNTSDIWMRRKANLESMPDEKIALWVRHDDNIDIYINGVPAAMKDGWSSYYDFVPVLPDARAALKTGENILAVHCWNRGGPQYVDVGIVVYPYAALPLTGWESSSKLEIFTKTVRDFMEENLIPAGTMAVMKKDRIVLARGIGYADHEQRTPIRADAILRLASLDKLVTNAAMKELIKRAPRLPTGENLNLDSPVFSILETYGVTVPKGKNADPALKDITVSQILEHSSGLAHFPGHGSLKVMEDLGIYGPSTPRDKTRWLMAQPLRFKPGTDQEYNSSAYAVARYLIHLVTGDISGFLKQEVFKPAMSTDIEVARDLPENRDTREPWYSSRNYLRNVMRPMANEYVPEPDGAINLEAAMALNASAEGMVRFLRRYHIGHGTPLVDPATEKWAAIPDNGYGVYFGAMGGTFTIAIQRRWDEVGIVVLFNQCGKYEHLAEELNEIVKKLPQDAWE